MRITCWASLTTSPTSLCSKSQVEPFLQSERKVFGPAMWCRQ
jgi:hypothetical protein